jgi:hypothetical protein
MALDLGQRDAGSEPVRHRTPGINLNGYVLNDAVGVSDNGQIIAGNARTMAASRAATSCLSAPRHHLTPPALTTSARLIVTLTLPGVTQTSIVNQTFSTQVDAVLNGSNLFTRTVGDQITGTLGVTALGRCPYCIATRQWLAPGGDRCAGAGVQHHHGAQQFEQHGERRLRHAG